jgi:hypothetical protein
LSGFRAFMATSSARDGYHGQRNPCVLAALELGYGSVPVFGVRVKRRQVGTAALGKLAHYAVEMATPDSWQRTRTDLWLSRAQPLAMAACSAVSSAPRNRDLSLLVSGAGPRVVALSWRGGCSCPYGRRNRGSSCRAGRRSLVQMPEGVPGAFPPPRALGPIGRAGGTTVTGNLGMYVRDQLHRRNWVRGKQRVPKGQQRTFAVFSTS